MKRRDYGLFFFSGGLVLLAIQFLVILFDVINGTSLSQQVQFVVVEELTFVDFITTVWSSLLGTVLLIVLYIRRFMKGPEAMLVLVGALLWVIQILNLYDPVVDLKQFFLTYIIGIIGTVLIIATGFYDAYLIKRTESADDSSDN